MTKEEALKKAINIVAYFEAHFAKSKEARKTAANIIEVLEQETCIQEKQANADKIDAVYIDGFKAGYSQARFDLEQEPCEDAISREAVIKAIDEHTIETKYGLCLDDDITCILEDIPPVQPRQNTAGDYMKFHVIDTTTGSEPTSEVIAEIAYNNGLMVHDIDGFGLSEDGALILMDDCGNYTYVSRTRFKAEVIG